MLYIEKVTWEPEIDAEVQNDLEKWGKSGVMKIMTGWFCMSGYGYVLVHDVENIETHTNNLISWKPVCVFDSFHVIKAS